MYKTIRALKFILYVRKSSRSEDRQAASIEDQITEMKEIAKRRGIEIVEVIIEAQSAKEPGRKEFNRMIKTIEQGKADGIICWKLNRLARNPIDGAQIIWLLQTGKIKQIVTYSGDHFPEDNNIILNVKFGMATQYVKELSSDVRRGNRNKAQRGWFPGAIPPGYLHRSPKKYENVVEEIIVDSVNGPIMKKIWRKAATCKYSVSELHTIAVKEGLLSKYGKPVSRSSFYRYLRNEFYCGYYVYTDKYGVRIRKKGQHKPLVSEAQFNMVQEHINTRSFPRQTVSKDTAFRELLSCGSCGKSITVEQKKRIYCPKCKKKQSVQNKDACPGCQTKLTELGDVSVYEKIYFRCAARSRGCKEPSLNLDEMTKEINSGFKQLQMPEGFMDCTLDILHEIKLREIEEGKNLRVNYKRQRTKYTDELKSLRLYAAKVNMQPDAYKELELELQEKLQKLEIRSDNSTFYKLLSDLEKRVLLLPKIEIDFKEAVKHEKTQILKSVCSNPMITQKKLYIHAYPPLLSLSEGLKRLKRKYPMFEPLNGLKQPLDMGVIEERDRIVSHVRAQLENVIYFL